MNAKICKALQTLSFLFYYILHFLVLLTLQKVCLIQRQFYMSAVHLGVCHLGRVEINERDIDGTCTSTCPDAKSYAIPLNHHCSRVENCRTKEPGWKGWFSRCNYCDCDCFIPCGK